MSGIISIATGFSSKSITWTNKEMLWDDLANKLSEVTRTGETFAEYMRANKEEQNALKDIGGYVGGYLIGGKRHIANVKYRQLITLDIDFATPTFWDSFIKRYSCEAVIHSTHKHTNEQPRLRLILPLSRPVSVEEYEAIARRIAGSLDIGLFDTTTFQVQRLMYWPSASEDGDYLYERQKGDWLDADTILNSYLDWQDIAEWPRVITQDLNIIARAKKQEDPTTKTGLVGLFCKTFSIEDAIAEFLSDVYLPTSDSRYSYVNGTTAGGLVLYNGIFAYSHHSTDPCSGRLCNAFDLVRIHKFGQLNTKVNPNASTLAMEEFVSNLPEVKLTLSREKRESAKEDFKIPFDSSNKELNWVKSLTINRFGLYDSSALNIQTIFQNDENLKGCFKLNTFNNKRYVCKSLPWRKIEKSTPFRDVDYAGIRNYLETVYDIVAVSKIDDALSLEFETNSFHPIRDYLAGLTWDGIPRLETLLIDYFGAPDNVYSRAAIKKPLLGAVTRVFQPGIKFDLVLTLIGAQGTGKSTFIKKLGQEWFSDTFSTVQGKEAYEQVQGAWIIEMAELSGLRRAEVETIKQYISKSEDTFRPAYGRTIETYPRQCIFMGTTNDETFLKDTSGNRRFMPITVNTTTTKNIFTDFTQTEVDQVWAEAFEMYCEGSEELYLLTKEDTIAIAERRAHLEEDNRLGYIKEYLDTLLPEGWEDYDLLKRISWLDNPIHAEGIYERKRVCIPEIWCECLRKDKNDLDRASAKDIHSIMRLMDDTWWRRQSDKSFNIYGRQRIYTRKSKQE